MSLLSEAPKEERLVKVVNQQEEIRDPSKEDVLQSYYATMLQKKGEGLTSDKLQGCDDDEWND